MPATEPTSEPTTADLDARRAARRYPERPIVAVLAVVLRGEGAAARALIVQRAQQPNAGRWGFPGGVLELGETVVEGAMRELCEETGIVAEPAGILNVHDAIHRDAEGRVQFHYTLIAVRGIWQRGRGRAGRRRGGLRLGQPRRHRGRSLPDLPDAAAAVRPRGGGRVMFRGFVWGVAATVVVGVAVAYLVLRGGLIPAGADAPPLPLEHWAAKTSLRCDARDREAPTGPNTRAC